MTREELLREICEAIKRGDYLVCESIEDRIARDPYYLVEEEWWDD